VAHILKGIEMAIQRSAATLASSCMPGDLVRIVDARGASYPSAAQLGPAVVALAGGMFGRVVLEHGETFLRPDARVPEIMRAMGDMKFGAGSTVERLSIDHSHELALIGLEYLQKIADVARKRATDGNGNVNPGLLKAMLGEAAGSDLRKIVDELTEAGIAVVEKVATTTTVKRTVILTSDPESVRQGLVHQGAMTFSSPEVTQAVDAVNVFDASRTREILLSTQPMTAVTGSESANPAVTPPATMNIMNLLGLDGALSMEDVGLDIDMDEEDPDAPAPR